MRLDRWGLPGWVLVVATAAAPPRLGPAVTPVTGPPAVQVVAFLAPEFGYQTAVTYDTAVTRQVALADLTRLAALLEYRSLTELQPTEPGREQPLPFHFETESGGLTVGLRLSERAFNRAKGTFKLEPFLLAYARYRRVDLDLMVGQYGDRIFAYRGVGNYENAAVRLHHHGAGGHHSFRAELLQPAATKLDLPPYAPPELPLETGGGSRRSPSGGQTAVLVALAGLAAVTTFGVVFYGLRRWVASGHRRRRPG
ncbi:MAG: hypothetical protein IT204_09110 [Fimbriimonadaceae bacterium]|nr:hypothetical protein [Fimbriimonadaceae bacterium]